MRARGFSLIELLISLALAGVVIAGALQLHISYNGQTARQQQIADMQQSLRVSMQILERAIRSAGSGMLIPPSAAPPATQYTGGVMMCGATKIYGFEFWNSNAFPAPYTATATGNTDPDPDYFKVIAAQPDVATAISYNQGSNTATFSGSLANWRNNELVLFLQGNFPAQPAAGTPLTCLRTISNVAGQTMTFASPGAPLPCNVAGDPCLNALPAAAVAGGNTDVEVKHFVNETVFRVLPPAQVGDTPKLALRQAPINDISANFPWMPIADNIEDMQLAMIMADGTVCNSVDVPTVCDPSQALAVRVTLVARSTNTIAGNPPAPKGGFEDEPLTQAPGDGYLRRSMTTEIGIRN